MDEIFSGFVPSVQWLRVVESRWTFGHSTIAVDASSERPGRWSTVLGIFGLSTVAERDARGQLVNVVAA